MAQIGKRDDFTSRLIGRYLRPGMRVLDVGCGAGEVSLLLADAVGEDGRVDGVDTNADAIAAARERAQQLGKGNVGFFVGDINDLGERGYDAVFGRRVLMYQPDPSKTIRALQSCLKPGGIMVFQESDERGSGLNGDDLPLHCQAQGWVWETVRREGGNTRIGGELYGLMRAGGLQVCDYCSELVLQTPETGTDLGWVVSVMRQRMESFGIHPDTRDLEQRLDEEARASTHAFVRDLAFGICAKKP